MNWTTTLSRLLTRGGSRRQRRRSDCTAMAGRHGGSGAALTPPVSCKCRRSTWTSVHGSLRKRGLTYTGNDNGVRMAPIASHADDACYNGGSAAWDCGTASWHAGNGDDEVTLRVLILRVHNFTLVTMNAVHSTVPILPNIGYDKRPRVSPTKELAEEDALYASTLKCRACSPMECGTTNAMQYIVPSTSLHGDSSPKDVYGGRWSLGPSLLTAGAVNGGGGYREFGTSRGCSNGKLYCPRKRVQRHIP